MDVELKVIKEYGNRDFRLVQNLTMGGAVLNQFLCLRNQLVIATENFVTGENLSAVLVLTMSRDMDEQLKLAHIMVGVVDRCSRKICVTRLLYKVDKPQSS